MEPELTAAFERVHNKLDENRNHLNNKIEGLNADVIQLQTKFDMTPTVRQPCCYFEEHKKHYDDHIAEHEKIRFIWVKAVVGAIVSAVAAAIGTVLFWGQHNK